MVSAKPLAVTYSLITTKGIDMRVLKTISSKDNMCNYCQNDIATCKKANHIKFGDGVGNDNVTECSELVIKSYSNNYPIIGTNTFAERIDLNKPS